jgi:hypothetical protein
VIIIIKRLVVGYSGFGKPYITMASSDSELVYCLHFPRQHGIETVDSE